MGFRRGLAEGLADASIGRTLPETSAVLVGDIGVGTSGHEWGQQIDLPLVDGDPEGGTTQIVGGRVDLGTAGQQGDDGFAITIMNCTIQGSPPGLVPPVDVGSLGHRIGNTIDAESPHRTEKSAQRGRRLGSLVPLPGPPGALGPPELRRDRGMVADADMGLGFEEVDHRPIAVDLGEMQSTLTAVSRVVVQVSMSN